MKVTIETADEESITRDNARQRRTLFETCLVRAEMVRHPERLHRLILAPSIDIRRKAPGTLLWSLMFVALGLSAAAHGQAVADAPPDHALDIRVDVGFTYDNNVSRGRAADEKLSDQSLSLNVSKSRTFPLAATTRVVLDGVVGGEAFHHYSGLGRIFGEIQGELQYRRSAEFHMPTLALFARATAEGFRSRLREGYRYSGGVSIRQPVTDRINVFGALAHNRRYGASSVFDARENQAQLNLDYSLGPGTLFLGGDFRRGDVVSTGRPTLDNLDIAEVFVRDDVFPGDDTFSYRFDAKTVVTTLGYNLPFGQNNSVDFSWKWAQSTPEDRASFSGAGRTRYLVNQLTLVFLRRF